MEREKDSISIRVNGKSRVATITNEINATSDRQLVNDSIIPQPDNLIDFTKVQEERKRNELPYWDDGNREKSPKLPFNRKKKPFNGVGKSPLPIMLFMALVSAIIIGLGLGYMILTIFTSNESEETLENGGVQADVMPVFSAKESLPTLSVEVVQGGAFSTVEKGEEMVSLLQDQGYSAVLTKTTDPIYLFIGVGGDRAQANSIGQLFLESGQEMYLKSYRIDGQGITDQAKEVSNWFVQAIDQYKELIQLTIDGFQGGTLVTAERLTQLNESMDALKIERDNAFVKLPSQVQQHALAMGDALSVANDKLGQYKQTANKTNLWNSQQALLDALIYYELVINAL